MKKITKKELVELKKLMIEREHAGFYSYLIITEMSKSKGMKMYRETRLNGKTINQYWNDVFKMNNDEIIKFLNTKLSIDEYDKVYFRCCSHEFYMLDYIWYDNN